MKLILYLYLMLFLNMASAQVVDTIIFDEFKAPSTPALILLDLQPTAISRPTTIKDFQVNIPSIINSKGFLQRTIALEFNPYGILRDSIISYENYIKRNMPFENIVRNSSISFATTDQDTALTGTIAGIGFKTIIFNGKPGSKLIEYRKALKTIQAINAGVNNLTFPGKFKDKLELEEALKSKFVVLNNDKSLDSNVLSANEKDLTRIIRDSDKDPGVIITELLEAVNAGGNFASLVLAAKNVEEAGKDRYGFLLEAAYSLAIQFPENNWSNSGIPRQGVWISGCYRSESVFGKKGSTDVVGVFRYIWNNIPDNTGVESSIDLGIKLAFEWNKLSLEGEGLIRYNQNIPTNLVALVRKRDERVTGTLSYQVNKNFLLSYTLGQNFDASFLNNNGDVISTIALNFATGFRKVSLR